MSCNCKLLSSGQGDMGSLVTRGLNVMGDVSGGIDDKLTPGVTVEDFTRPEFWWLRRGNLFGSFGTEAAVAGQVSIIQLVPRAGLTQNAIAIIDSVILTNTNAAAATYDIGLGIATGFNSSLGICALDSRQDMGGVLPGGISQFDLQRSNQAVASAIFGQRVRVAPATSFVVPGTWLVHTGNPLSFMIQTGAGNTAITASFQWRERYLQQTEQ